MIKQYEDRIEVTTDDGTVAIYDSAYKATTDKMVLVADATGLSIDDPIVDRADAIMWRRTEESA